MGRDEKILRKVGFVMKSKKHFGKRVVSLLLAGIMTFTIVPADVSEAAADVSSEVSQGLPADWEPPVGGLKQPEVIEVSDEAVAGLEIVGDEKEATADNGRMAVFSATYGSQQYSSPWDIYSSNYIYNHLNEKQRKFWDALDTIGRKYLTTTANGSKTIVDGHLCYMTSMGVKLGSLTVEQAKNVFIMFSYSNPQYYFFDGGYLRSSTALYPSIYERFLNGRTRQSETAKVKAQIDAMEREIAKGQSTVEKVQIAHDLIIKKVKYDHDYENVFRHTQYHQSAYSVLCEGYTVCAGYAKTFEILMNGAGIDAIGVTSTGHAWNLVCINDTWYQIDCTWDDTDGRYAGFGEVWYTFFNRSDAKMMELDSVNHLTEYFYYNLIPSCPIDSGATELSIGNYFTPVTTTARPIISLKQVSNGIKVTIKTGAPGAKIYYTLDGKTPSASYSRSNRYTKSFTVTKNVTVKAVAVCSQSRNSSIASAKAYGKMCTVKFNTMGGKKISSKKVHYNKTVKKPSTPKRSGYKFKGWYKDKKCKNVWKFKTKIKKNMTLYAKWVKVS